MGGMDQNLLQGFETSDDAAVYKMSDDIATVLTVDFLTPLVDDPYDFGRLAAANALSDVFAMGGKPLCALNVLALDCALGNDVAREILQGGADAVKEAGAIIVGGHSVDDPEPKYGLCVMGAVHPDRIIRNGGAQAGDLLFLTKRLGTGLMSAAYKIDEISMEQFQPVIDSMCELNRAGGEAMVAAEAHAGTDVTGFALAGHLHEMLAASGNDGMDAVIDFAALPLFEEAWQLSCDYCRPNRTFSIMDFSEPFLEQGSLGDEEFDNRLGVVCDPQTSGGILAAIAPENAETFRAAFRAAAGRDPWCIGTIVAPAEGAEGGHIRFSDGGENVERDDEQGIRILSSQLHRPSCCS